MTDPTGPDDSPTLPNVYGGPPAGSAPPPGFWDELRSEGSSPLAGQPGWTQWNAGPPAAGYGADYGGGYGGYGEASPPYEERPAVIIPASAPDGGARRRGALLAVGGVVLATVVVVLATLVIGPHLSPSSSAPTNDVAPPLSPTGSPTAGLDPTSMTSAISSSPVPSSDAPSGPTLVTSPVPSTPATTTTAGTATTTAPATTGSVGVSSVTVGGSGSGTGGSTTTTPTTHSAPPVVTSTIVSSTTAQADLGVPLREIACSNGLIVQLASELNANAFRARVSQLKGQGLVPGDAAAATSAGSCGIFSNQHNTYILYSGPFGALQDACNDRLAGPYDAYIKGGNPGSAGTFYSCICPARADQLPTIGQLGQTGQWVGELQRMLGAHLRYSVGGLDNSTWGVYTRGTRTAVKKFQTDHHQKADGVVDAKTWAALQGAGC